MNTLQIVGSAVCVAYESPMQDEPKVIINHWPTTESVVDIKQHWPHWIGQEVLGDGHQGTFSIRMGSQPFSGWHTLQLKDGAKTKSIHTVSKDIPCPKVRKGIDTCYRNGQWWKCLKTRGWVPA